MATELRLPAIEIRQGKNRRLYTFAVDGKELPSFTTVSRIFRGAEQKVEGYQRPEVLSHIAEIREYIESESPMIPNAIVVAFDQRVRFEPSKKAEETPYSHTGVLVIPIEKDQLDAMKPGWIVDGQQRAAAIRDAKVEHFPICVVSFIAQDAQEQREQFILVNSTKPLPKGLVYELLPVTEAKLPSLLQRRRFPTVLLDRLNLDADSPLKGLIQTPTVPGGTIRDNSLIKMLENSLSDGALYRFRIGGDDKGDVEGMLKVVKDFWAAVAEVFKSAWGVPPRKSRLMHGAGVVSLGSLMDAIADRHRQSGVPTRKQFKDDLEPLKDVCCWTDGHWEFGPGTIRKWNEVQNTHKDIQMLANYLLVKYKALVWNKAGGAA
ncbi:DGQHR domain-containing protein DpdB [Gemmata sp. JC717]|uniref:DGQHR domain-containing protein DpdB n=1 Tax=Gemmata algarum TaxID=2975278 RepID=UPI0021BAB6A3|nr:DGQHR domain-containing protein DpdB [Gemmata algarum]MDY3551367.1 DGQHR domain-containing protein DpdB [Gemmata algarum]